MAGRCASHDARPAPQVAAKAGADMRAELLSLVGGYVEGAVDEDAPLAAQGLDSLAMLELRQRIEAQAARCPAFCQNSSIVSSPRAATIDAEIVCTLQQTVWAP